MLIICTLVALMVGIVLGVVASGRRGADSADTVVTALAPDDPVRERGQPEEVLDRLDLAVVVSSDDGTVEYRNRRAMAMEGTHVGVLVDGHIDHAIRAATQTGNVQRRVELHGPPRVSLELRAQRLGGGRVVVIVEDVSERSRIDAMRTDFVANISHELKTPVGALAVLAEALDGETDLDVIAMVAGRLVDEAHRAVTTIDDLLELAQIETASAGTDVVDLADVVQASVARARTIDPDVDVEIDGAAIPLSVRGDARQLTSAVGNLVENAVKYSDPGGRVHVSTGVDGDVVEVVVSDEGVGIPERDLDRVFERFYRVDRARSRTTGGTGLGLAIVRHVANNHGGDVVVSSQEGDGSTFVLRLPTTLRVHRESET